MPYKDKETIREYNRQYHLKNWPQRKARHQESKRKRRATLALWLRTYKKTLSCIKCDENHPACLDFHHKNGKEKDAKVANMVSEGFAIKTIIEEINKCIVLCRNCHAKEHYKII